MLQLPGGLIPGGWIRSDRSLDDVHERRRHVWPEIAEAIAMALAMSTLQIDDGSAFHR